MTGGPGGALIAGAWRTDGCTLPVRDKRDGTVLGRVRDCGPGDVAAAVAGVTTAQDEPWPLWRRRAALEAASRLVAAEADRLAGLIRAEAGKTAADADAEVRRCAETLRLCGAAADVLRGEVLGFEDTERGAGRRGWFVRRPLGVLAAITPFNDPLNLVAHKLGPALLAGNGVLLKPAEAAPLSGLALADLLVRAGVPAARLAVLCGGAATGAALVADPRVDAVSFTGGPRTAAAISAAAGPKKLLMELGGNNATIVRADADIDAAAAAIVSGAFGCAGQNCLSVQRVYAHRPVYAELLARVAARTDKLRTGPEATADVGPMISEAEAARVEEWVARAVAGGARVAAGGGRDGAYARPTVLTDVPDGAQVVREEVFGPVVTLAPVDGDDAAVAAANGTAYALQAGVFTGSLDAAFALADRLVAGAVVINGTSDVRIDSMPFGGFRGSGIGREGVRFAVEAMSEPKSTIVQRIS